MPMSVASSFAKCWLLSWHIGFLSNIVFCFSGALCNRMSQLRASYKCKIFAEFISRDSRFSLSIVVACVRVYTAPVCLWKMELRLGYILLLCIGLCYAEIFLPFPLGDPLNAAQILRRMELSENQIAKRDIQRRQTPNEQRIAQLLQCNLPAVRLQCTTGLQQQMVNAAVNCGENVQARLFAGACATNANGEYCSVAVLNNALQLDRVLLDCISAIRGGSCSSDCRNSLMTFRNSWGCCINTLYNFTGHPLMDPGNPNLQIVSSIFSNSFWSSCGVETVSSCQNSIPFSTVHNSPICTNLTFHQRIAALQCGENFGQQIVDAIIRQDGCYEVAKAHADACGINPQGQHCAGVIGADLDAVVNSGVTSLTSVRSRCSRMNETCTSSCRSAIQVFRNTLGCCVNNLYNTSIVNSLQLGGQHFATSYGLWSSCNVDTPSVCPTMLSGCAATKGFFGVILLMIAIQNFLLYWLSTSAESFELY